MRTVAAPSTALRRFYSSKSASTPRHLLSIADLSASELSALVRNAAKAKRDIKSGHNSTSLAGKAVAMMFSKRSTRTRVSTEAAVVHLGGHPMFLGKDDIQLGVSPSQIHPSLYRILIPIANPPPTRRSTNPSTTPPP